MVVKSLRRVGVQDLRLRLAGSEFRTSVKGLESTVCLGKLS